MFDHHDGAPQEVVRHAGEVLLQKTGKHAWDDVPHSKQQERGSRRALDRENARSFVTMASPRCRAISTSASSVAACKPRSRTWTAGYPDVSSAPHREGGRFMSRSSRSPDNQATSRIRSVADQAA